MWNSDRTILFATIHSYDSSFKTKYSESKKYCSRSCSKRMDSRRNSHPFLFTGCKLLKNNISNNIIAPTFVHRIFTCTLFYVQIYFVRDSINFTISSIFFSTDTPISVESVNTGIFVFSIHFLCCASSASK